MVLHAQHDFVATRYLMLLQRYVLCFPQPRDQSCLWSMLHILCESKTLQPACRR